MTVFYEGAIAFLCAVGLAAVVWVLAGTLLRRSAPRVPELMLVLPLRGEAPAMEADMRELRRLRNELCGARIVLADCGLTEDAKALAQYLASREQDADFVDAGELLIR